jgi:hypothetical protein
MNPFPSPTSAAGCATPTVRSDNRGCRSPAPTDVGARDRSPRVMLLSRQPACPACGPHEHHLLPCDVDDCTCHDVPTLGIPA